MQSTREEGISPKPVCSAGRISPDPQLSHQRHGVSAGKLSRVLLRNTCHLRQVRVGSKRRLNRRNRLHLRCSYNTRSLQGLGTPRITAGIYYAGVMWRLIAYSSSSAFVLTFRVSIIRYL